MTDDQGEWGIEVPLELITTAEAARMLGVHPDTLKGYPIPYVVINRKGDRRYSPTDLRAWLDRVRVDPGVA